MSKQLLVALFIFLALTACNFQKRENSTKQNEEDSSQTHSEIRLADKELEYLKIRDRYVNYFKSPIEKDYDVVLKQDNDSLLVLEKILKEILKDANIDGISKNGKINLETLLPEMGFGGLDGLVLNKNNYFDNKAPQIVVTTKTLFFDYFKGDGINSLDSLTTEQLDNIFTSALGRGEVHATTFSIVKKSFTKSGQTYGCIGILGQEGCPPNHILVLELNEGYIYIFSEYLDYSIKELHECQLISNRLDSLSKIYSQQYDSSNKEDKSLINKAVEFQTASSEQYCECYEKNLKDKTVFEKIKNQVINVMMYAEK